MFQRVGGKGYETYGVDKVKGAIVVVRPDGYVGMIAPYEALDDLKEYFAGFMKAS